MTYTDFSKEFDRQVSNLLQKGYPKEAKISEDAFLQLVSPLREKIAKQSLPETDFENGQLPFVIVVKSELIDAEKMMSLVQYNEKTGNPKLYPHTSQDFHTTQTVIIPPTSVYLLIDIDRGKEFLNVRPNEALIQIQKVGRSPLTIDEGIAVITQFPEFLKKNNCFSLLASRVSGNQRVPAIWINASKQAHLGWCWDGNPHTWLGSTSAKSRIASSA